jgi:hypothetical protein
MYGEWKALVELDSLPLMKSGYSIEADMKFGWKPVIKGKILPIPLLFDREDEFFNVDHYSCYITLKKKLPVIYRGWRPVDSFKMYKKYLNDTNIYHGSEFSFKIPVGLPAILKKLMDH